MGDTPLKFKIPLLSYTLFGTLIIESLANNQIAVDTQRDCRICHGPITIRHNRKPPFIEFGANYLRRQIIHENYAPYYDYKFIRDLYPKVRHNRSLKNIIHAKNLKKRLALLPKYESVFLNDDQKNDSTQSELRIAARNTLKYFCKKYQVIEFKRLKLKSIEEKSGKHLIYFQFIFDTLHLRELPDFLDVLANSNYFTLDDDPNVKYVATKHPLHKMNQHYYQVIQEGIIHPEEFDL